MNNITSRSDLLNSFKFLNIELSNEEKAEINSIFSKVDTSDDSGKPCSGGDGYLNSKEYYLFSRLIKNVKSLYEKFTQTGIYVVNEDFNSLKHLFLSGDLDENFLKDLSTEEVTGFIKDVSFTRGGYIEKDKVEQLFKIQFQLLKDNNCYTEDLEKLVNVLLANYSFDDININPSKMSSLETLKYHINQRLSAVKDSKEQEIKEPNGQIDADFKQGHTGDCWLLSSIKAIASDEKGLEKLNNMISVQKNGEELVSVTVHLQGKDYIISSEELYSSVEYSTGDLDVRALEIAVNRFCIESSYKDITAGGQSGLGYSFLLGDADEVKEFVKKKPWDIVLDRNFEDDLRTRSRVGTIDGAYPNKYAIDVETGEKVPIVEYHEYAIIGSDSEFVYLSNPHDSAQKLKLDINDIRDTFVKGMLYDIT